MRKTDRVVVMKHWVDNVIDMLSEEQLKEFSYAILKYGLYEEYYESKDVAVKMALNFVLPQIDLMLDSYEERKEFGTNVGRKKSINDMEVWNMYQQGMSGAEIARKLGKPTSTIYSTDGWKNRDNPKYGEGSDFGF